MGNTHILIQRGEGGEGAIVVAQRWTWPLSGFLPQLVLLPPSPPRKRREETFFGEYR